MFTYRWTFVWVLTILLVPAMPAWAGGGRWRQRGQSQATQTQQATPNAAVDRREQSERANAIDPKFNGGFHSRFYTEYGFPSGTYGLRGLPW